MNELAEALEGTDLGGVEDFAEVDDVGDPICPDWDVNAFSWFEEDGIDPFESVESADPPWWH